MSKAKLTTTVLRRKLCAMDRQIMGPWAVFPITIIANRGSCSIFPSEAVAMHRSGSFQSTHSQEENGTSRATRSKLGPFAHNNHCIQYTIKHLCLSTYEESRLCLILKYSTSSQNLPQHISTCISTLRIWAFQLGRASSF